MRGERFRDRKLEEGEQVASSTPAAREARKLPLKEGSTPRGLPPAFTPGFFKRLEQLKIRTRRSYLGSRQGSHISPKKGQGLEFADFRPYAMGDDYRQIDWGVYARTDRLYVREYRAEQDLNVLVLLDTSSSMNFPPDDSNLNKFNLAKNIALSLSYVALADGDAVLICPLGQQSGPRLSGHKSLSKAASQLESLELLPELDFETSVRKALGQQKIPGKCFIISDFLFDFDKQARALDFVRGKNFEICALQILSPKELRLDVSWKTVVDSETGEELELALDSSSVKEYARALMQHVEQLENYCHKAGIRHVLINSKEELSEIVLNRLPRLGVL